MFVYMHFMTNTITACKHGTVQLVDGLYAFEGRLEVCLNGQWGTICDIGWSRVESTVVCNQLGIIAFRNNNEK